MPKKIILIAISLLFILSACSPAVATPEVMVEKPTEAVIDKPTETMSEKPTEVMVESAVDAPAWFNVLLVDVNTGQQFKISDFKGKVVLVENLAMWCSNCKKQQGQVKALHDLLGSDSDLISIGLDVDPNELAEDLMRYTNNNGFDWVYSIAPVEVINEISNIYGAQFLNPPSTPILVIDRKGEIHLMPFGIKSADELMKFIEPFLSESV